MRRTQSGDGTGASEWEARVDQKSGRTYYTNRVTGERTWDTAAEEEHPAHVQLRHVELTRPKIKEDVPAWASRGKNASRPRVGKLDFVDDDVRSRPPRILITPKSWYWGVFRDRVSRSQSKCGRYNIMYVHRR